MNWAEGVICSVGIELDVIGGVVLLYLKELRMIIEKVKSRNIKLNYFNLITNATIKSEEMVEYTTFPEECEFVISAEYFHIEECPDIIKNSKWYQEKITNCIVRNNVRDSSIIAYPETKGNLLPEDYLYMTRFMYLETPT